MKKKKIIAILTLCLVCAASLSCFPMDFETAEVYGEIQIKKSNSDQTSVSLPYTLLTLTPTYPGEKFPLILILHGAGQLGKNYFGTWKDEAVKKRFMIVSPEWETAYGNVPENGEGFEGLIKSLIRQYPIDEKRIYVGGVSAGARVALELVLRDSVSFQGAVLIASSPLLEWIKDADPKKLPPFLYVQGADDQGFPASKIQGRAEELRRKGGNADLMIIPNAGHEHRPEWNEKIFEWMEKQTGE